MKSSFLSLALGSVWVFASFADALSAQVPAAAKKKESARREVVWNNPGGPARPGITHHVLKSPSMEREVGYNVYLPPGYESGSLRYPVIYFLHGAGGNENSDGPGFARFVVKLIQAKEISPVICVFPNGGMSSYRDHPETKIMVETMIIKELVPLVDATYRTRPERGSRVIAGYSMGAGGAARLALVYPELFSAAGGWGLSFTGRSTDTPLPPEFKPEALNRTKDRVRLLMIIGLNDPGLAGYGPTLKALTDAKYPFTYRTLENVGHNLGLYYELTGDDMVRFLMQGVAPPS